MQVRAKSRARRRASEGQGLAEYALLLALIAIVAIIALTFLGSQLAAIFSYIGDQFFPL